MQNTIEIKKIYQELIDIENALQEKKTYFEDFTDEDTQEVVTIERYELVSRKPNAEESARIAELIVILLSRCAELDDDELETMYYATKRLAFLEEAMKRNLDWAIDDDDDDVNFVTYTITSDKKASLDAIETMIDELCAKFGTPENIADGLTMNLPYSSVMKLLIGESRFTGQVEYKERTDDSLILNCSCTYRSIDALADAIEEIFKVKVEVTIE